MSTTGLILTEEEIQIIIAEEQAKYEVVEDELRAKRLAGRSCSCCDAPLPADSAGPECAECATL